MTGKVAVNEESGSGVRSDDVPIIIDEMGQPLDDGERLDEKADAVGWLADLDVPYPESDQAYPNRIAIALLSNYEKGRSTRQSNE